MRWRRILLSRTEITSRISKGVRAVITSGTNARVKRLVNLGKKAKSRYGEGVFIVEGIKMFLEAPTEWVKEIYVSERFLEKNPSMQFQGKRYEVVSEEVFEKISDTQTPQGVLCVMKMPEYKLGELLKINKKQLLFLVLEDIQDPGNLGTMFRAGEGAGIDGVIMTKNTVDIFNPKVIRSTMGSIYRVPFVITDDILQTIADLRTGGVTVCAAHLKDSVNYDLQDYTKSTAFLIGNEANGLKDETANRADCYIKIPMKGQVESLNAAVASSVLLYEAARQRRV